MSVPATALWANAGKRRIFVSSVQKELELERAALATILTTDPFLVQHCEPVLFEKDPPPSRPAPRPYLDALRSCDLYLLLIATEYGYRDGDLSATHREYRLAQELKLPTLVFIKGRNDAGRSAEARAFIEEIKSAGHTYKRFDDRQDLQPEVLRAVARWLGEEFGIRATPQEIADSERQIDAASIFERKILYDFPVSDLDQTLLLQFTRAILGNTATSADADVALRSRGLAVQGASASECYVTVGARLLFAPQAASPYPHCQILADAYDGEWANGQPRGLLTINAPLPTAIEQALKFIDDHTFHPYRVVGLYNVRLDEYPTRALRESLANALAHRNYEDEARRIFVRVFSDRVEVVSPGYPLKPLTQARLLRGNYRPCTRNPLIAEGLRTLGQMELRGTGFRRMRDAMLNHGLDEPRFTLEDGFFVATFAGPNRNYERLILPADTPVPVPPAVESQLNERQRKIMTEVLMNGSTTNRWCRTQFGVGNNTAYRDLQELMSLGLLKVIGSGRNAKYVAEMGNDKLSTIIR